MKKTILQSTIIITIILVLGIFLLIKSGFFTTYDTKYFNEIMTPIFTIISCIVYFVTLLQLKKSYDQNENTQVFLLVKDKLESIRKTLEEKKFHHLSHDEETKDLYNNSSSFNFLNVYDYYLRKFHNLYSENLDKTDKLTYMINFNKYKIKDDYVPEELRDIMGPVSLMLSQVGKDYSELDEVITRLRYYKFNSIHSLELDLKIDEMYSQLRYLFEIENRSGVFDYIIVYKENEFPIKENQIPNYYFDGSYKSILNNSYQLQKINENYLEYKNRIK